MGDESRTRHVHGAHALQMRRRDLGIEQRKAPSLQRAAKRDQATLEPLVAPLNIDSPKNMRPIENA
jgi:hypothetical protein